VPIPPGISLGEPVFFAKEVLDDEVDHLGVMRTPPVAAIPSFFRALPAFRSSRHGPPVLALAPLAPELVAFDLRERAGDEGRDARGPGPGVSGVELFEDADVPVDASE
jgi:hypothetical protein